MNGLGWHRQKQISVRLQRAAASSSTVAGRVRLNDPSAAKGSFCAWHRSMKRRPISSAG